MEATLILCDAADEVGGKLYVLGGGWTHAMTADQPMNMSLGLVVNVPWDRTNERHQLKATLLTDDGEPVEVAGTVIEQYGLLEVGRPAGLKRGTTLNAVLAFGFNGVVLGEGGYVWELRINNDEMARTPFWIVRPPS